MISGRSNAYHLRRAGEHEDGIIALKLVANLQLVIYPPVSLVLICDTLFKRLHFPDSQRFFAGESPFPWPIWYRSCCIQVILAIDYISIL